MPNPEQLSSFVSWYQKHITGDEKGRAQIFLDRLFRSFGLQGYLNAAAPLNSASVNPAGQRQDRRHRIGSPGITEYFAVANFNREKSGLKA